MITLTLPAKEIPCGTVVRKKTGTTGYILRRGIRIYGEGGHEIQSDEGLIFLITAGNGNINCIKDSKELSIDMSYDDAMALIRELKDKEDLDYK